jgi:hypothetical protein
MNTITILQNNGRPHPSSSPDVSLIFLIMSDGFPGASYLGESGLPSWIPHIAALSIVSLATTGHFVENACELIAIELFNNNIMPS